MSDVLIYGIGAVLLLLSGGFVYLAYTINKLAKAQSNHEVKYFDYTEDNSGVLKNSRRYIVKGQIYIHGLPVGSPFVVSEHIIEEFDLDKFIKLRNEVFMPLLNMTVNVALALKGAGGTAKGVFDAAVKGVRSKAG